MTVQGTQPNRMLLGDLQFSQLLIKTSVSSPTTESMKGSGKLSGI